MLASKLRDMFMPRPEPEITASDLVFSGVENPQAIAEALIRHGAVLLRGAVETERFEFWRAALHYVHGCDQLLMKVDKDYRRNGDFVTTMKFIEQFGVQVDIGEFRDMFRRTRIREIAERYFALRAHKSFLDLPPEISYRRIRQYDPPLLKHHLDAGYLGSHFDECLTVWMPLHDIRPEQCAALEVIAKPFDDPMKAFKKTNTAELQALAAEEVPAGLDALILPQDLSAGDVYVFNERVIHRTTARSHQTQLRYSIDFRYAVPGRTAHTIMTAEPVVVTLS